MVLSKDAGIRVAELMRISIDKPQAMTLMMEQIISL
jgi:hypothetical protein